MKWVTRERARVDVRRAVRVLPFPRAIALTGGVGSPVARPRGWRGLAPGPDGHVVGDVAPARVARGRGGLAAWLGFTVPSALVLVLFACGLQATGVADAG